MAEASEEREHQPQKLSDRIENHRREVQYLIKQGGEQSQYEFKRAVSLGRENLDDRLDFVKLMQAVANAEIATERCIVIGADLKQKKFYAVTNSEEFDPANLSKILSAYLDPLPKFQTFNLTTDANEQFVLIALDANQSRPIIVTKAGQTERGKTRLEVGDIWIKMNTDTVRATRADIDLMYKVRSEEEAEDRARKRVKHHRAQHSRGQPSCPCRSPPGARADGKLPRRPGPVRRGRRVGNLLKQSRDTGSHFRSSLSVGLPSCPLFPFPSFFRTRNGALRVWAEPADPAACAEPARAGSRARSQALTYKGSGFKSQAPNASVRAKNSSPNAKVVFERVSQ